MAPIELADGKLYGAVGYPIVMTSLSGIEVLGALTSRTKFVAGNGAARFREFWRNFLYAERPAFSKLDTLVYEFVRHGLGHSFMTKPMVVITKYRAAEHLCRRNDDVLSIDAFTLADDLERAYVERVKPRVNGDLRPVMEARFREMRDTDWEERESKKNHLAKAPIVFASQRLNISTRVESPSVQVIRYSTNVSTTDFNDPNT